MSIPCILHACSNVSLAEEGHLIQPRPISLNASTVSGWYCNIAPIYDYFEITIMVVLSVFIIYIICLMVS